MKPATQRKGKSGKPGTEKQPAISFINGPLFDAVCEIEALEALAECATDVADSATNTSEASQAHAKRLVNLVYMIDDKAKALLEIVRKFPADMLPVGVRQ
jgi:hypothetical protein